MPNTNRGTLLDHWSIKCSHFVTVIRANNALRLAYIPSAFYTTCYVSTGTMYNVLPIYIISRLHCLLLRSTTLTLVAVSQGEVITSDFITINLYIPLGIGLKCGLSL